MRIGFPCSSWHGSVSSHSCQENEAHERPRAAGLDTTRMAFEAAFPGYAVTDLDELDAMIERDRAA